MTLVLLALTVAIALARTSIVRFLRRSQPYIGRVSGGLVALAGAYVAWYWLDTEPGTGGSAGSDITDTVYGWSSDVTAVDQRRRLGPHRRRGGHPAGRDGPRRAGGPHPGGPGDAAGDAGDATPGTTASGAATGRGSAPHPGSADGRQGARRSTRQPAGRVASRR